MKKNRMIIIASFCAIVLCIVTSTFATLKLVIPTIGQEGDNTCWAATCRMVLHAYGSPQSEQTLRNYATNGQDKGNCLYSYDVTSKCCDGILMQYASISSLSKSSYLPFDGPFSVKSEIDGNRPILVRKTPNLSEHIMLIVGYTVLNEVIVKDPLPKNQGSEIYKNYDLFVEENVTNRWTHTLRLTTPPPNPIPTPEPPVDFVWISNGTAEITPSTTSLSYTATRNFSTSAAWTWELSFPYIYGDNTVRDWTVTGSTSYVSTWNITGFSMPTGYNWLYCFNGKIPGKAKVTLSYSGTTLKAEKDVLFVPNDLYPGCVFYCDKTVSTSQPDVKAHENVFMQNDVFNSGANIDIKSGGSISITEGITINNGSSADFIIDPSYW